MFQEVPDELWNKVEPILAPPQRKRPRREKASTAKVGLPVRLRTQTGGKEPEEGLGPNPTDRGKRARSSFSL